MGCKDREVLAFLQELPLSRLVTACEEDSGTDQCHVWPAEKHRVQLAGVRQGDSYVTDAIAWFP